MISSLRIVQVISVILACFSLSLSYAVGTVVSSPASAPHTGATSSQTPTLTTITPAAAITPSITPAPTTSTAAPATKAAPAPTTATVGKVVWVKGIFKAMGPDMKPRSLSKGDSIFLHDTLITDNVTQAQIVFTDDTLMTFRPDTTFFVNDYSYDSSKGTSKGSIGKYVMSLVTGGFRTITGFIAKANPSDYKVNTPVATIGVRGTDYAVYLKDGELFVGYYKGSPCVSSQNQTLCLDKTTPYAKVPSVSAAPVPLTQQPAVFREKVAITKATFSSMTTTVNGPLGPNSLTPNGTVNGVLSSFCIQ